MNELNNKEAIVNAVLNEAPSESQGIGGGSSANAGAESPLKALSTNAVKGEAGILR